MPSEGNILCEGHLHIIKTKLYNEKPLEVAINVSWAK